MPPLMGVDSNISALIWSSWGGDWLSAALGRGELGKKAFGKKRITFDKAEAFTWTRNGEDAELIVGEEKQLGANSLRARRIVC
jgi:leader peptidase (prepilin peptidase)/N-methyltransferase